jgi:hypothetical protein
MAECFIALPMDEILVGYAFDIILYRGMLTGKHARGADVTPSHNLNHLSRSAHYLDNNHS